MQRRIDRQRSEQSGRPTIGIIGAGIGGLTAALALSQHGFEVDVFEQTPQLTEVGGGISISPNAARSPETWARSKTCVRRCT
ncbi:MAG: NAD(P)-binding protein, partial [Mycobacterium sp.]